MTSTPPISCASAQADLTAFHEGDLDEARAVAIDAHLSQCGTCRGAREEMALLDRWIDRESSPAASPDFIDRAVDAMVHERMEALAASPAFVDDTVSAMLRDRGRLRRRTWLPYLVTTTALAAAVLLVVLWPRSGPATPSEIAQTATLDGFARDRALLASGRWMGSRSADALDMPTPLNDHLAHLALSIDHE